MNSAGKKYVLGIDYGTDSVRSVIVDAADGHEIASGISEYRRWKKGMYCDPLRSMYRQHPADYIEGLKTSVKECISKAGRGAATAVCAIVVDTTGSTPVAADSRGIPLALLPQFSEDPDAMFILWKDHTSLSEADQINAAAGSDKYLKYVGGVYSSEWFWAKILNVMRRNPAVASACHTWMEHCDWMTFLLTGGDDPSCIRRSVCPAGHKGLYSPEWGGYPPAEYLGAIDLSLAKVAASLPRTCYPAGTPVGKLSPQWAAELGLGEDVVVCTGALDAHIGAVGGVLRPGSMSMVIGTSTCDMLVKQYTGRPDEGLVPGICGSVPDSIIPGMIGMEAGQSAFGDIYAWFGNLLCWSAAPAEENGKAPKEQLPEVMRRLNEQAADLPWDENAELALDWMNGRRTPDANHNVKGAIVNLTLGSDAPRIFRALVEATCFGARAIVERFAAYGVPVNEVIALGGISRRSPFVMQTLADILQMPISVSRSLQTCALGSAMFAAVGAGIYRNIEEAMDAMGQGFDIEYRPDASRRELYEKRYAAYLKLSGFVESL